MEQMKKRKKYKGKLVGYYFDGKRMKTLYEKKK